MLYDPAAAREGLLYLAAFFGVAALCGTRVACGILAVLLFVYYCRTTSLVLS